MDKDLESVLEAAMAHTHQLPMSKRISVYRGVALVMGNGEQAETLRKLAAELEAVDQRCFAFAQQFAQGGKR